MLFQTIIVLGVILITLAFITACLPLFILGFIAAGAGIFLLTAQTISNYVRFDDEKLDSLRGQLSVAIPEINKVQMYGSDKSFTLNKKACYICLKDEQGEYYPDNMLVYVILHELAHSLCTEIDHTPKYVKIFNSLLNRAEKAGLYDSSIPPIQGYCGYN
jgi:hypothetical protein